MSGTGLPDPAAVLAVLGAAALLWPGPRRRSDLADRGRVDPVPSGRRRGPPLPVLRSAATTTGVVGLVALAGWTGPAVAAALGVAIGTALVLLRTTARRRRHRRMSVDLLAAARQLAAELRAGAPPDRAVQLTVASAPQAVAAGIRQAVRTPPEPSAHTAPEPSAGGTAGAPPAVVDGLALLAAGWALAHRHGLSLATVVQSVVDQLTRNAEAEERRTAEASGARLSGHLLAALPLLGLLLGTGMGVDPVQVLLRTGLGNAALLAGTVLTAAGLLWTTALSGRGR